MVVQALMEPVASMRCPANVDNVPHGVANHVYARGARRVQLGPPSGKLVEGLATKLAKQSSDYMSFHRFYSLGYS
jgi:hypothetical protein